jgi:hypothetical protein
MDVLDRHFLLTLAAMAVQSFKQRDVGPGEFVRLIQVFPPSFECLFAQHGAPVALHRSVETGEDRSSRGAMPIIASTVAWRILLKSFDWQRNCSNGWRGCFTKLEYLILNHLR